MSVTLSSTQFAQLTSSAAATEQYSVAMGTNYLVVDMRQDPYAIPLPAFWPACVVIGITTNSPSAADVLAKDDAEVGRLIDLIEAQPVAAATLVQILRHNARATIEQGLLAESLAYSTLQQSEGFQQWLARADRPATRADTLPPLLVKRRDQGQESRLELTLNRPQAHNAYSTELKDALCEALQLAHEDRRVRQVTLKGSGPSFSAGGDLSEFGSVADAGLAHVSRTTRSAAMLLSTLSCDTSAQLHGACIGAGIELPAFTRHITAHPDTFFQLPEVAMGLIPGAGGTVSVLRRSGRQRTAWMALTNARVNAHTALQWGLIDELSA